MEHPEWFIGEAATDWIGHKSRPYVRFRLFNFGNPDARKWMTDLISQRITELKIDIFRQDCNFSLPEFWRAVDTPTRQGIAEIRYVEGLLEFWDELLRRHPGLMLDITQRADLETISRGMDLTRSDYPIWPEADPMGNQAATMGLAYWRPHFGTCFQTRPGDTYYFRSAFCPGVAFSTFTGSGTRDQIGSFTPPDFPFAWARTMTQH
jgi:alpha-galactosidase